MGLEVVPSAASLARIFHEAGVAQLVLRGRARAVWRWFVYSVPGAWWQLDASEDVLTCGRGRVIFRLLDDYSCSVASHCVG